MNEIPKELQEAIQKCNNAQKQLKKRQQQYCINKYYEKKEKEKSKNG